MPKKSTPQKMNPPKQRVQNGKVRKPKPTMTLIATSQMLAEREYTAEQTMNVQPLEEGIDQNMIKQEEIKLETEVEPCSSNSAHITTEKSVKKEPESYLMTEEFSNPTPAGTTVSISARKKRKIVAKEMEKIADQQRKRQEKRARNSGRHNENTAQLPEYREYPQSLNRTVIGVDDVEELGSVSSFDIDNEANASDTEIQNFRTSETSTPGNTSQAADHSTTHIDETMPETNSNVDNAEELNSVSSFDFDNEANASDAETQNMQVPGTSMASDTNPAVHSTSVKSGTKMSEKRYKCSQCSYATADSCVLKMHMRTHSGEKPYMCSHCSFATAHSRALKRHMRTHTGEKPYKCSHCSFAGASSWQLKSHMRTHTGEKPYKCSQCSFASAQCTDLKKHMRTHSGEKLYKCIHCSYAAIRADVLKRHMRTHSGEKPYMCIHCSFAGAESGHLKRHMRTHTGEKPYKCSKCSYACAQSGDLKSHMRTHSGEKPYKCIHCSYAAIRADVLKRHSRTHSGETPYKCSQCSFASAQSGHLKSHMRTHTKDKPYKCDQCFYACTDSSDLKKHMRSHTKKKPYKCSECSFASDQAGNLKSHMRTHI